MDPTEAIVMPLVIGMLFIGLPWLILHYVTRWKTAGTLTSEDESLLDEMHALARRLDDRVCTIERILDAEQPGWRVGCSPEQPALTTPRNARLETRQ